MTRHPHFTRHPERVNGSLTEQLEVIRRELQAPPPSGQAESVCIDDFPGKGRGLRAMKHLAAGADILPLNLIASCDFYFAIEARIAVGVGLFEVQYSINATQVDKDLYIFHGEPGVRGNHSCVPNAALVAIPDGGYAYRALREIAPGEEVTWDYSSTIADYFVMQCHGCGAGCRGFASRPSFMTEAQRHRLRERYPQDWLLPYMRIELGRSFSLEGIDPHLLPYGWDGEGSYTAFVAQNPHFDPRLKALLTAADR